MATATPSPKVNHIGLPVLEYRGGKSTLCAGCGHNAISERIIDALYEMGVEPERVMKMSGIGCSSKSPAYFLSRAHSFNSVHGRMPSVSTGAILANHQMTMLGVSGDGDTASIGMGQFVHLMRRNLPMIYIIENNGVYGLTKGQFSATADLGSRLKTGVVNDLPAIDTCALAIQLGATFIGRSFSGDKKQLLSMLKAAIAHKGTVLLDVISNSAETRNATANVPIRVRRTIGENSRNDAAITAIRESVRRRRVAWGGHRSFGTGWTANHNPERCRSWRGCQRE